MHCLLICSCQFLWSQHVGLPRITKRINVRHILWHFTSVSVSDALWSPETLCCTSGKNSYVRALSLGNWNWPKLHPIQFSISSVSIWIESLGCMLKGQNDLHSTFLYRNWITSPLRNGFPSADVNFPDVLSVPYSFFLFSRASSHNECSRSAPYLKTSSEYLCPNAKASSQPARKPGIRSRLWSVPDRK